MLFEQELTTLLKTEIAVIMNDGQAYRGILVRFDNEVVVLENVYETSNDEIDWVEVSDDKSKATAIKGYIPWRRVTLPKLIVRVPMILRIWPWATTAQAPNLKKKKKD
jgi:small nuclear ribonucleoprotein (snRNP)-like protein